MHHQVCTIAPTRAILAPFFCSLPDPVAVQAPEVCACGEPLDLEMERDLGECANCQAEAAGVSNRRPQ